MKTQPTPAHGYHCTYRNSLTRIVALVAVNNFLNDDHHE
jgi:hypothetical protein